MKSVLRVFGVLALIFVACFFLLLFGGEWAVQLPITIAFGWVFYLIKTLPKVSVNWGAVLLFILTVGLAGGLGHGFCRWLWKGTGHEEPWRRRWTASGLAIVLVMFAAGMAVTGIAHQTGWLIRSPEPLTHSSGGVSNERSACASLKTVATAQADFRENDRDGNGKKDFWRGDIAGLYTTVPPGGSSPQNAIKLIELSVAGADARPLKSVEEFTRRMPKAGYWYRSLPFRKETTPDPDHFAACAVPDSRSSGRHYFIISDDYVLFRRHIDQGPAPEFYPDDPVKEGWEKMD